MMQTRFVAPFLIALACSFASEAQTFTHVETRHEFGRYDVVFEVADLNRDGRDDLVVGAEAFGDGQPEDRFRKSVVRVFFGTKSGRLRPAPPRFVQGTVRARVPVVVAADLNNDGQPDLAVFDAGVYVGERSIGVGNPPQLFLSRRGRLYRSAALANAVRREHRRNHDPDSYSGLADLHLKAAAAGDLDNDGDVDLWVQSIGGANVSVHVMVNNGDETFTVDTERVSEQVLHNQPHGYWYFAGVHLADIDGDGDLDVLQGQSRDLSPATRNQYNIVLVNDGTGRFPSRIELPHARFYKGFTAVAEMTDFDMNGDGLQDLLLVHSRNDAIPEYPNALPFTGRHIQALINRGDMSFGDETSTWIKGQGATRQQRFPNGDHLYNAAAPVMRDLDRDGCADLLMSHTVVPIRKQSPIAYRNNGRGQFRPLPPRRFAGDDPYFGHGAVAADVNGDGATDFVVPRWEPGADGRFDTRDDFTTFTTLLNTTPPKPLRCGR